MILLCCSEKNILGRGRLICRHIPILVNRIYIYKSLVVALVISFLLCLCTFVNGFQFEIPLGFESKSQCIYEVLWALKAKISTHDGIRKHLGIFQPAMLDWKANQRPQQRKPSKIRWLLRQAHPNGWSLGSESTITTCVPSRSSFGSCRLAIFFLHPLISQHFLNKTYTYTWWKFHCYVILPKGYIPSLETKTQHGIARSRSEIYIPRVLLFDSLVQSPCRLFNDIVIAVAVEKNESSRFMLEKWRLSHRTSCSFRPKWVSISHDSCIPIPERSKNWYPHEN